MSFDLYKRKSIKVMHNGWIPYKFHLTWTVMFVIIIYRYKNNKFNCLHFGIIIYSTGHMRNIIQLMVYLAMSGVIFPRLSSVTQVYSNLFSHTQNYVCIEEEILSTKQKKTPYQLYHWYRQQSHITQNSHRQHSFK